jgi:hypothetical protein
LPAGSSVVAVGLLLSIVFSNGLGASPCDGECVRPLIYDVAYRGGEILFIVAVIDLVAVAVWRRRKR